jgi:hypothetical protein
MNIFVYFFSNASGLPCAKSLPQWAEKAFASSILVFHALSKPTHIYKWFPKKKKNIYFNKVHFRHGPDQYNGLHLGRLPRPQTPVPYNLTIRKGERAMALTRKYATWATEHQFAFDLGRDSSLNNLLSCVNYFLNCVLFITFSNFLKIKKYIEWL